MWECVASNAHVDSEEKKEKVLIHGDVVEMAADVMDF